MRNRQPARSAQGSQAGQDRLVRSAARSLCFNLLYALYNGWLGLAGRSVWFIAMFAYYAILSTLRFSAVLCARKSPTAGGLEYFVMKLSGALLTVLGLVLGSMVYLSTAEHIASKHDAIVMITIATYTFYKITVAILRAVKRRQYPSLLLAAIRGIGYADVAASALTLQRSMLASFGGLAEAEVLTMNVLTGTAVCLFVLALGITMMIKGTKRKENKNGEIQNSKGE
ncbi:MAG: hypothetical protein ACI4JU_02930 [Angelakisella sp.]